MRIEWSVEGYVELKWSAWAMRKGRESIVRRELREYVSLGRSE
jgi:hypothetical protein